MVQANLPFQGLADDAKLVFARYIANASTLNRLEELVADDSLSVETVCNVFLNVSDCDRTEAQKVLRKAIDQGRFGAPTDRLLEAAGMPIALAW